MGRPEHGATPIDAIIHNVEIVVPRVVMFVNTVKPPLVGR